jgi:cytochrome c biogenesis protein CcmG/thiol:disulfide interchange protein DsbE
MRVSFASVLLRSSGAAVLVAASAVLLAQESGSRATLVSSAERKPAPDFALKDSAGKQFSLKDYRGKILLLDFWARWCHGCKQEMPWFVDLHRKYRESGLEVVGVSMDDDGWKAVTPFIKSAAVPYQIVLGDDKTAKDYHIEGMPDTFLIDREGRLAAVYNGMVDREDIEKNVQSLLQTNQQQ